MKFKELPNHKYFKYLDKAEYIHNMGLMEHKTLTELAEEIYEREKHENKIN